MKKLAIVLVLGVSFVLNAIAQPNGGFENWHTEFSYQVPDSWQTYNFMSLMSPPNEISATKATGIDKHSGNYALKIKTIYFNTNPFPAEIGDTSGIAFTGKLQVTPFTYNYGFPYTSRPEILEFWSKYIPVGGDTGGVAVVLAKWNGTGRDTIAFGSMSITTTTAYSLFQVHLTYYSTALPDSAVILFASSKLPAIARQNSTLYLDDVAFTGWVGISENKISEEKVNVFPNPAKNDITIMAQMEEADNVQVFDSFGKFYGIYNVQNYSTKINTSQYTEGTYLYEIRNKKNIGISRGKFNIIK